MQGLRKLAKLSRGREAAGPSAHACGSPQETKSSRPRLWITNRRIAFSSWCNSSLYRGSRRLLPDPRPLTWRPILRLLVPRSHTCSTTPRPFFLAALDVFRPENLASRTLFTTSPKPGDRLFRFFLVPISTTYPPGPLLTPNPSRILDWGPDKQISEENSRIPAIYCHRVFRGQLWRTAMPHESEDLTIKEEKAIATLVNCQTVAKAAKVAEWVRAASPASSNGTLSTLPT